MVETQDTPGEIEIEINNELGIMKVQNSLTKRVIIQGPCVNLEKMR